MEGIFTAWGRILAGYRPALSIEITRECPLRCPGLLRLRRRAPRRRRHAAPGQRLQGPGAHRRAFLALIDEHRPLHVSIVGGEPLVRFRELNEILPRLAERGIYTQLVTSAVRPIPMRMGGAAAPADRRVDRRPAARARRAAQAGDLRSHPQAHRRAPDHRALHGHAAAGAARRVPRGVRRRSGRPTRTRSRSGSASTRRRSARCRTERLTPEDRERVVARLLRAAPALPEAADAEGDDQGLRQAAAVARRVHLRADDDVRVGGLRAPDHAVPVRRQAGLLQLRLHRVGRPRRGRASSPARRRCASARSSSESLRIGRGGAKRMRAGSAAS